jgi:hypothetical protein
VLGGRDNTPFASKYFEGAEEADDGNLLIMRGLQRPGEDKYNTFDAVWQKDPATGDYTLVDVEDTKEKASWKKHGAGIAKVAAGLGTMYLGGLGLQALGVPGAGAATGATTGVGSSALGQGAWLGEGVASGVPAWDASAKGIGALAQGAAPALNMATIESGLGTPGYGYNAAAEASGLFDPAVIGSGAGLPFPGEDVVEIVDKFLPREEAPYSNEGRNYPTPESTQGPGGSPVNASIYEPPVIPDYSNEGRNYPTPESTQGPGGSPVNASTTTTPNPFLDWLLKNPMLATQLIGLVGGGLAGNNDTPAPTTPAGSSTQPNLTNKAPALQRQINPAPANYRHGFEPEHRFFTGIGQLGTGS